MICEFCGSKDSYRTFIPYIMKEAYVCWDCEDKFKEKEVDAKLETVRNAEDYAGWKRQDLSEAFWLHLGKYQKCPNQRSLSIMRTALLWAYHDAPGLANSFYHALKWSGIILEKELERKDLPPTDRGEENNEKGGEQGV